MRGDRGGVVDGAARSGDLRGVADEAGVYGDGVHWPSDAGLRAGQPGSNREEIGVCVLGETGAGVQSARGGFAKGEAKNAGQEEGTTKSRKREKALNVRDNNSSKSRRGLLFKIE